MAFENNCYRTLFASASHHAYTQRPESCRAHCEDGTLLEIVKDEALTSDGFELW